MRLFGRSERSIIASAELPPAEVYGALIDDLHAPLFSLVAGAATTILVGAMATWRTGNLWIAALTICAAVVTVARISTISKYRKQRPRCGNDVNFLDRYERLYAVGAIVYAAVLGLMALVAYAFTEDAVSFLLITANVVGYSAGATARNSGRPSIATAQLAMLLVPTAIGAAMRAQLPYAILTLNAVLYLMSSIEIVRYLGANRLRLLMATRETAELAGSLAEQNMLFDATLNNMAQGLCMFDAEQRLRMANRRFAEIFQIAPAALSPGMMMGEVMLLAQAADSDPGYAAAAQQQLLAGSSTPILTTLADGRMISIAHRPMPNGGIVATFEDVTEQRRIEARASFLATHDTLTGLPNWIVFGQEVNSVVEGGTGRGRQCAVLFVDIDRFKIINNTLGHTAGDTLLIEIARRIEQCLNARDVVTRIKPLMVGGQEVRVTASIGISLFPLDARDEVTLAKNAEAAMYAAKDAGRNMFLLHSNDMKTQSIERLMLETGLRRAIEHGEFVLHYQPRLDLRRGYVSGVEALLRWQHPDLGLLQPNQFVPLAEETGLIVPIGRWVLETACAQNMHWQRQGLPALRVAVNLSPRQFVDPNLLNDIRTSLGQVGMPPSLLELEITESMVMQDLARTVRLLNEVKDLGITIAIDDFGTGYSSMAMVRELPIDALKIDRSFVREISRDTEGKAIINAIIALGRALRLTVIAEGVETNEQEAFLREHQCDEEQGYLISMPLPPDEFTAFMAEHMRAQLRAQAAEAAAHRRARPTGTMG
jgi:predicted signal transduction protein with EAL and GGDEF domain